jgi:DNA-binding NtrC family response regulator
VLIVDQSNEVRSGVASVLGRQGITSVEASSGEVGLRLATASHFDVMLVDPVLPGLGGTDLLRAIVDAAKQSVLIVTSTYASPEGAVEAMRAGAFDYLGKPVRSEELILVVKRAFESIGERAAPEEDDEERFAGIVGRSPAMRHIFELIDKVAPSSATVLVEGESGTGKELVARAIHSRGKRRAFPFVSVHCSAIPTTLLESELFGHERGAFTGAHKAQKGKFELADRGTLLLDEIGTLDERAQIDLLRVLQEREFTRLGGSETIRTEARVIATSNEPLRGLTEQGVFRRDLYYRLHVVHLELPPLRDRVSDIPALVKHFVERYAGENERMVPEVAEETLAILCRWPWLGNARELENVIERAIVMGSGQVLRPEHLPAEIREPEAWAKAAAGPDEDDLGLERRISALEKQLIERALRASHYHRARAADLLEISDRALRYKTKKYAIDVRSPGVYGRSAT